jgi:hypothetical protein
MPGDCMSVSITPTRCPSAANRAAMFAVLLDLPVPPRNEWIEMIVAMNFLQYETGSVFLVMKGRMDPHYMVPL